MHKPQEGICAEPSIHSWVLLLEVVSDDVHGLRQQLSRFPQMVEQLAVRFSDAQLSCVLAIGESYWDVLAATRPRELAPQPTFLGNEYPLPATQTDLALILRADRIDANYFAGRVMLEWLRDFVVLHQEIQGFRYLDGRDLYGFRLDAHIPHGKNRRALSFIAPQESKEFAAGSYLWLQLYTIDSQRWDQLTLAEQEEVMGREKLTGKAYVTEQANHRNKTQTFFMQEQEQALWRIQMPVANLHVPSELILHWSASQKHIEQFLAQRYCGEWGSDPLLEYQVAQANALFFAPSRTWLAEL